MHVNRYGAFLAHLLISATIVGIFLLLTFFIWYPSPLFVVEGTLLPLQILVAVDVILGPLLTLIVFKPGKPSLKIDLGVIALIQLSAFIYGSSIIYTERPAFVAFASKDFTVVSTAETKELEMDKLDTTKVTISSYGPTWVYAKLPDDPAVATQIIYDILNGAKDFSHRPEYYQDLESNIEKSFYRAIDLKAYGEKYKDSKHLIDAFLEEKNKKLDDIAAFPLGGKHHDMVIVIDKTSKNVAGYIDINPWAPLTDKKKQPMTTK